MSHTDGLLVAVAGAMAALVTWIIVSVLVRCASRIGLVDQPNDRSLHTRPTPRGGGIGFVVAIAAILTVFAAVGGNRFGFVGRSSYLPLAAYLGAALLIAAISLRDDFKSLGAGLRILFHFAAAGTSLAGIGYFRYYSIPGFHTADFGRLGAALTFVWIIGLTNVYNFMDGIDGIAGIQGIIAGLGWAAAGAWQGSFEVAILGLLLAGGCLGFILHNWSPAKIFMGDVGSAFLGYSFSILPLLSLHEAEKSGKSAFAGAIPVFALLAVWPFVGDGMLTFIRRARNRDALWRPHRSHLYQRLVRVGWSHARVSGFYLTWCTLSLLVGILWLCGGFYGNLFAALFPLASLLCVYATVKGQERRASECHASI
jgi:Fuc2NAc and GlcNAc transferase